MCTNQQKERISEGCHRRGFNIKLEGKKEDDFRSDQLLQYYSKKPSVAKALHACLVVS